MWDSVSVNTHMLSLYYSQRLWVCFSLWAEEHKHVGWTQEHFIQRLFTRRQLNCVTESVCVCVCVCVCVWEGHPVTSLCYFLLSAAHKQTCSPPLLNDDFMMHSGASCKCGKSPHESPVKLTFLLFPFVDQHQLLLSLMSCSYKQLFNWLSIRYHSQAHEKKLIIKRLWLNSRIFYSRSQNTPVRAVIPSPQLL